MPSAIIYQITPKLRSKSLETISQFSNNCVACLGMLLVSHTTCSVSLFADIFFLLNLNVFDPGPLCVTVFEWFLLMNPGRMLTIQTHWIEGNPHGNL